MYHIGRNKFESVHLACARRNRNFEYTCLAGTYCVKRTMPTPLTAFQTIFDIFYLLLYAEKSLAQMLPLTVKLLRLAEESCGTMHLGMLRSLCG